MDLFEALEWSNWKNLSMEVKIQVINQVLMYFVSPLKKVSDVTYCEFKLSGVKCDTFECSIDGERFVLVPGNKEVILGWDLGTQGLPVATWEAKKKNVSEYLDTMMQSYDLTTTEDWDNFVNESTSGLRKVKIAPMLVQKNALPAGTDYLGYFNLITGEFKGLVESYSLIESSFQQHFAQPKTLEESLLCPLPEEIFEENQFYAVLEPEEDHYRIYSHQACTLASLRKKVNQDVFDLLSEDEWEYAVGGGTRKLFRWGSELPLGKSYSNKKIFQKINHMNMFGLNFDTSRTHWEVTDSNRLKLEKMTETKIPLFDYLPLSSYYRSRKILSEDEWLEPSAFLYRKAIVLKLE